MLTSLHHLIDREWMLEAYRLTRKDGAPGVDGMMATDYEANLDVNLDDLLARIKSGRYIAPPVRRHYIPKADGTERPLGIPTLEDKVAQRAILLLLEPIYETDFLPCSYGFRSGRSAHDALHALRTGFMEQGLRWVVDVDISKYFDTIDHAHLRRFLDQRVTDGVVRRMIDKWLKAGVVEKGILRRTTGGTPQGGVISPLLANVYLHYVLDEWFEYVARPRLKGRCQLVRYADDAVIAFEDHLSGKRLLNVLAKRLDRYGLQLHPTKTRFVDFRFKRLGGRHPATAGTTFNFLGFTHVWGLSRQGKNVVRQITAKDRTRAGFCDGMVSAKPALSIPGAARPSVAGDPGALRLLRHLRKRPTHQMVPPPSHADMEEMARTAWPPQQSAVDALPSHARAIPAANSQDRPPICRLVSEACA
ncbi:group II intron reverse transcriptase/maturase [Bradyrhizobium sp. UFLA01-814]|uniref:group II intron reverse transcriptase/maturase n=1 Tax=Bradyrhizobium sp. UFLA01-814 TaxID=3023480 RepID=UPI00398BA7F6